MLMAIAGVRSILVASVFCSVLLITVGCGTAVKPTYAPGFSPPQGTKVQLGTIEDKVPSEKRGEAKDFDIQAELRTQLEEQLSKVGLLVPDNTTKPHVKLLVTIMNYEPGSAFHRWLMPGLGATKLSIKCMLLGSGKEVGTITVDRHVSAGGGYTIGQWKIIFKDVAADVVKELRKKLGA